MPVWYPSLVCNMQLRFDEAFNVLEDQSPAAQSPTSREQGLDQTYGPPTVRPLVLSGSKDDLTQVGGRIPKSGTVELNGYRQAHTFDLTFDFRDLPVDPRVIRDARIEIFLGVVRPDDFARGMVRPNADGTRSSIISTELSSTNRTNLLLVGMVDEGYVDHGPKGSTVNLKGRDLRGLLIDAKADPRVFRDLDLTRNIQVVVLQILSRLPFSQKINVYTNAQEWPDGQLPSPATKDGATRVRLGADGKQRPMSTPSGPGDKIGFWDLITKYCFLVGAVPYFEGKDIQIRPLTSVYQQVTFDGTRPTPFAGGKQRKLKLDGTTEQISIRRFVYGRNVESVKFGRKYRGQKVPLIQCISIDTSSKQRGLQKLVIGQWPDNTSKDPKNKKKIDAALKTSVAPSGQVSQTEALRFPIPGIKSKTILTNIARGLYEEIGRNELSIQVASKDFASFNTDDGDDPDMLTLRPGDAVQIMVDRRPLSSNLPLVAEWTEQQRQPFAQAVDTIAKRLGDKNLARVLVATARNNIIELQDTFRTKNVKYTLAEGGAVGIDFDAENYIEVRAGAPNPKATPITGKPSGKAAS